MLTNFAKRGVVAAFIIILSVPAVSSANSYQYHYQTQSFSQSQSQASQLAYLYTVIAQLQAQLAQLQASHGGSTSYNPYNPNPSVSTTDRLEARTDGVRVQNGEVVLNGTIDFDVRDSARAWFEYGTDRDVRSSTQAVDVSGNANSSKSVSIPASVIRSNTSYFYRFVAEDSRGDYSEGVLRSFTVGRYSNDYDDDDNDSDDEDYPSVSTEDADDVDYDRAELNGEVDMNDYEEGRVFFVYGEDEDAVEEVEDEDSYGDVDTDGDDLQKILLDNSFDDDDSFSYDVYGLDEDTEYFFRICVEFEDEDDDERLVCGSVEEFETDSN